MGKKIDRRGYPTNNASEPRIPKRATRCIGFFTVKSIGWEEQPMVDKDFYKGLCLPFINSGNIRFFKENVMLPSMIFAGFSLVQQ